MLKSVRRAVVSWTNVTTSSSWGRAEAVSNASSSTRNTETFFRCLPTIVSNNMNMAASWEIFLGSGLSVQIGSYVYRILKIVSKTWPWCSVQGELRLRDRLFEGGLALQIHSRGCQPLHNVQVTQLSNLRWMPNSVSKGFDTAMKPGSSRLLKWYPTTYRWECQVSFPLLRIKVYPGLS